MRAWRNGPAPSSLFFFFLGEVPVYDCFGDAHVSAGFSPKSGVPMGISSVSRGIFMAAPWTFLLGFGGIGLLPCATFIRCTVGVLGAGCGSLLVPRDSASSSTSNKPQRSPPKFQNCKALGALLLPRHPALPGEKLEIVLTLKKDALEGIFLPSPPSAGGPGLCPPDLWGGGDGGWLFSPPPRFLLP